MRFERMGWLTGLALAVTGCVSQPQAVGVLSDRDTQEDAASSSNPTRDSGFSNITFIGGVPDNTPIDPFHAYRDIVSVTVSDQTLKTIADASERPAPTSQPVQARTASTAKNVAAAAPAKAQPARSDSSRRLVNLGRDFELGSVPDTLLDDTVFSVVATSYGLDPWTLYALALFETGRIDADTGVLRPHPYVIHHQGKKDYFPTRAEAEARIDALEASGVSNYDIGVLQINRKWHAKTVGGPKNLLNVDDSLTVAANILRRAFRATPDDYTLAVGRFRGWNEEIARPFGERLWHIRKQLPNPKNVMSESDRKQPIVPVEPGATAGIF